MDSGDNRVLWRISAENPLCNSPDNLSPSPLPDVLTELSQPDYPDPVNIREYDKGRVIQI